MQGACPLLATKNVTVTVAVTEAVTGAVTEAVWGSCMLLRFCNVKRNAPVSGACGRDARAPRMGDQPVALKQTINHDSVTETVTVGDRACDIDPSSNPTPPPHPQRAWMRP